jgi:hypothetical protein
VFMVFIHTKKVEIGSFIQARIRIRSQTSESDQIRIRNTGSERIYEYLAGCVVSLPNPEFLTFFFFSPDWNIHDSLAQLIGQPFNTFTWVRSRFM